MRKTFLILAIIFTIISIAFSVLPFDTLALAPIGVTLIFIFIAFKKSSVEQRNSFHNCLYLCYCRFRKNISDKRQSSSRHPI